MKSCNLSWLSCSFSLQPYCSSCTTVSRCDRREGPGSLSSSACQACLSSEQHVWEPCTSCVLLQQRVPPSNKIIPLQTFLQGLTYSLLWSLHAPYLLGRKAGNWDASSETSTNQVHTAQVRGRLQPVQAPCQSLALVWQDSWAPDLCAFNQEGENLSLEEKSTALHTSTAAWLPEGLRLQSSRCLWGCRR